MAAGVDTSMWERLANGPNPLDSYIRMKQIKVGLDAAAQEKQLRSLQIQHEQMQMSELSRQQNEAAAVRGAYAGAVQPAGDVTEQMPGLQLPTPDGGTTTLPGLAKSIGAPARIDQNTLMSNMTQAAPQQAMAMQAQQQQEALAHQKQMMEVQKSLGDMDKTRLENISKQMGIVGQMANAVLNAPDQLKPQVYAQVHQQATQMGLDTSSLPPQFDPSVIPALQQHANEAMSVKDMADAQHAKATAAETARHNSATELKANQTLSETQRHNATEEGLTARGQELAHGGGSLPLTPAQVSLVDEIGMGKMALNRVDYLLSRNPSLAGAVAQKYPDFDSSKIKSYTTAYTSFTSGADSKQINSGGVALQHLKQLKDINDANPTTVRIPGTAANKAYSNLLDTVADELVTFYGEPKTNEAIASKKATLGGFANRDAAITEQASAMGVKFDEMEQKWKNAAPSKAYEAPLPGVSAKATAARAALDPEYAKRAAPQAAGGAALRPNTQLPGGAAPMFATNPQTKQRIMSNDGGQTWQPAQ